MYLLASDNWLRENMYHAYECGAWYSSELQKGETKEWCLSYNKKGRITGVRIGGRTLGDVRTGLLFERVYGKIHAGFKGLL